jgi:hypothetical protein
MTEETEHFHFEKNAEMCEEHAALVNRTLATFAPIIAALPYEASGSVVVSLAARWLSGFKKKEHQVAMAKAIGDALMKDVLEGETIQ